MITDKTRQLKQDLIEVNGAIEEIQPYLMTGGLKEEYVDLMDKFSLLQEHLKDHIEDVETFVGRIN